MGSARRSQLPAALLLAPLVLQMMFLPPAAAANRRPHIILIIADDLGWNDVGVHGSQLVPTPHVDALASAGRLLRRHYTLPTCTPSRAALLTGRHAAATGMQGFPLRAGEPRGLPLRVRTLPQQLRTRGYATHLVGKWHLGGHRPAFLPTRRGFDSHFGYRNGYVGYFDHGLHRIFPGGQSFTGRDLWRDETPAESSITESREYLTHVFTREAARIIQQHAASTPESPLFLQLAHLAVHAGNDTNPLEVPDEAVAHNRFPYESSAGRRLYAEMVSHLDDSVGSVLEALRDSAMLNDSIVIFISDNGGMSVGLHQNLGSNWPFRGTKHTLFEGGVHTVGAIWSPRMRALGSPYEHPIHVSDWAPTLLAAADEGVSGGQGDNQEEEDIFAGVSHWEALSAPAEEEAAAPRETMLLNVDDVIGHSAVLIDHWKYVEGSHEGGAYDEHLGAAARGTGYPEYDAQQVAQVAQALGLDPSLTASHVLHIRNAAQISCNGLEDALGSPPCAEGCLFDLREDPCETRDASASSPAQLQRLRALLAVFRAQQAAQLNQPVDPGADPALHGGVWAPWLPDVCGDDYEGDQDYSDFCEDGSGSGSGSAGRLCATAASAAAAAAVTTAFTHLRWGL